MARDVARKARDSVRRKGTLNYQDYLENLLIVKYKKEKEQNYI